MFGIGLKCLRRDVEKTTNTEYNWNKFLWFCHSRFSRVPSTVILRDWSDRSLDHWTTWEMQASWCAIRRDQLTQEISRCTWHVGWYKVWPALYCRLATRRSPNVADDLPSASACACADPQSPPATTLTAAVRALLDTRQNENKRGYVAEKVSTRATL